MSKRTQNALQKLKQSLVFRGFSKKTIKSYVYNSEKFLDYPDKNSQNCDEKAVRECF